MRLHPAAWLAWLGGVAVFAFVVTDPAYLALALGAIVVVHLSFPPQATSARRAVRTFFVMGVVVLAIRLVFVALLTNPGQTTLVTLPRLTVPRLLGGFGLGGPVTAEVLVAAAIEGLRLILLLTAFGVFNAHADLPSVVRNVPPAFRDAGLVVSIALAFVPGIMRSARDVRDAQRMRGESGRRVALSLAVPVLGLGLERALLLAESMDARGYGRGEVTDAARTFLWTGLAALAAGAGGWAAGFRSVSAVLVAAGAVAIVLAFRSASMRSPVTRLARRAVGGSDLLTIGAAALLCALALFERHALSYTPYPRFAVPSFDIRAGALALLLVVPSFERAR